MILEFILPERTVTEQGTGQGDEVLASSHLVYLGNMAACGLVTGYAWV